MMNPKQLGLMRSRIQCVSVRYGLGCQDWPGLSVDIDFTSVARHLSTSSSEISEKRMLSGLISERGEMGDKISYELTYRYVLCQDYAVARALEEAERW
jgi:hypothetical protein